MGTASIGAVGRQVATNVRSLRQARGLSFTELSDDLALVGHKIPALGLRRLECGERRVDVDDLAALAGVLGVTTDQLMFLDVVVTMVSS
jgi:transcriptional regulator with XRE-family HTH domain